MIHRHPMLLVLLTLMLPMLQFFVV